MIERRPGFGLTTESNKISTDFAARIARLGLEQMIRAIVLLDTSGVQKLASHCQSHRERKATIRAMREAAEGALADIDDILERFGGRRLVETATCLGTIAVEITAAGIHGLAASERVKAIIEDQPVVLIR